MRTIKLFMKKFSKIPLEFDNILPEKLYDKTQKQVEETIIYRGNRKEPLNKYFKVTIDGTTTNPDECTIIMDGNMERVKYIGNLMSCGSIIVNSNVDLHVGAQMSGGYIRVNGNTESYAGREMTGGLLEIKGNTKEFLGSSYAGEWRGMSGGCIIVEGSAGRYAGDCMLNGQIIIKKNCDILVGNHMSGGYIEVDGNITRWPGGSMKKGVIVVGGCVDEVLQGFKKQEKIHNPLINNKYHIGTYTLYTGDNTTRGKGQLWIKNK
ncbi:MULTISPECIES: formylmethanofuran dehydrogenase subunit C [Methanosphaera]|uniref:formylmethanofuran dehydrogenase n=2 Tax=Methanosphaera stadtmanae TaxID=2317 RepID=Q2NHH2_METST|nr:MULTISPECIES: formylmethanofuran dehydrogenase subunit C [Methanosphaera]ABC56661.1 FwdC [Methanosphaera stadtmanae DSM 3091]MDO5822137.1 formylmethanofuran dehydrogenase subunit C [Methanosphaera sp.]OEC92255.1 formylmethanofuran dehydrogenase subunit C [Methanosphaera sp. A6]RAP03616.1 formylmethanofuran dehydrogenase subunit C [Methanosphaera stadtmanae]RAP48437.1 MAG: formylmethanofuran dehydrogenase subunit C [Methanosphaera sp. DEW79]